MNHYIRSSRYEVNNSRHVVVPLFNTQWGIIIPEPTGIFYDIQTGGVCCHHPQIEGIYIPLRYPTKYVPAEDRMTASVDSLRPRWRCLLEEIAGYNRNYAGDEETDKIWAEVKEYLKMDWEDVNDSNTEEGLMKIKITKVNLESTFYDDLRSLIGEEVYLIYPNSD